VRKFNLGMLYYQGCCWLKFLKPRLFIHHHFGINYLKEHEDYLFNLIKGKKVLILGSGTSLNDLKNIPKDVLVFTCNSSFIIPFKKGLLNRIDLYLVKDETINFYKNKRNTNIIFWLKRFSNIKNIIINNDLQLKFAYDFELKNTKVMKDIIHNNFYAISFIYPQRIWKFFNNWLYGARESSSGIRLLQYALYFKAKEVYLIGVDCAGGYAWDSKIDASPHKDFDNPFCELISKKYNNVFSVSKDSPIIKYFKFKGLK
jgi:hypothetical protein